MPQVQESSAVTVHAKAQQKYPPGRTTPEACVPILLCRQGQDVFHLPGLEEPSVGHPWSLHGDRGFALAGRICRVVQTGPMGTVPQAGRERDRPGLPACPAPSQRRGSSSRRRAICRAPMVTAWRQRIRSGGKNMPRGSNWTNGDGSTSWTGRIPPSWTRRTICRAPMATAWRQRIRSGGKNMPRGSNWTNGDGSTSWTGARPTGPTSVSGPLPEEGEVEQEEGDDPGSFTQMRSRDTDTESEDTTPGRES